MNYKDFPQEIKEKVKIRIEEQGNTYSEEVLNKNIHAGKGSGGFEWVDTPEGHSFWKLVLNDYYFNSFYESYPKEYSFERPFQKNDIVKCVKNTYNRNTECIGKLFKLDQTGANNLNKGGIAIPDSYPSGELNEYNVNYSADCFVIVGRTTKAKEESKTKKTKKEEQINSINNLQHDDVQTTPTTDSRTDCSIKGAVYRKQDFPQIRCGY